MTPRQLVERALRGGHGPRVPFTIYECMIPQCSAERAMRNRGLCIVERRVPVFHTHRPNVKVSERSYWEDDKRFTRAVYETPVGTVSTLGEHADFTVWRHEKMFKTPDDYRPILFMIQDERYAPNYEAFALAERQAGEDIIFRAGLGLEPLQALVSGVFMDMQDFCVQWMDNRDEILKVYGAIVENRRKAYRLVAESPALHANYGGNVVPEVIGLEAFRDYYVPHYDEAAEVMHEHGKLIGCHFDANCRLLADAIAGTELDYVEAFTPAPDTDMTLGEARAAWPDKALWLNFPSSIHIKPDAEVEAAMVAMLNELDGVDGLLVGITEDMPPERWRDSCTAIMDGLDRHARESAHLYA
ncbi:MAG: hypothetical protein KAX44_03730 [Candidatus Brocadiae bacterium]|nr:hypothetical protein [Candidatus Brocadiia bacterium]